MLGAAGLSGEADGVKLSATANSLRASIASGNASMNGISVRLSDIPGQHIQLSAHTDASGVFSGARLVVPQGGDIQLSGKNWSANIGQSDTRLTQTDGVWGVDSRNFDINGTWKDVAVTAEGKRFDAMLAGNQLILNHITGTNVNVRASGYNVDINIKQLDNLIANVTTVHGLAQGAAITLEPSADNSHLTASISTVAAGIPIKLEINDARAFEALALVQPNQARLQLQDPTGQGTIKLAVGPLSIEGQGEIGAVATYHQFSEIRMAQDAARMGAGFDVTPNLRISPDGAFTLHTSARNTPLYVSGTFLAPIDPPFPWMDPMQLPYQNNLVPTPAPGFIGRIGVQREVTDRDGHTKTQAAFVYGGLSGSSRTAIDIQGQAKLFGAVPLPNHMDIPTTAQAGVGFENGNWRGTLGAHATPGALHSQYVVDPRPYGAELGLNYTTGNMSVDVGVTVDRREAGVGPGTQRAGIDAAGMARLKFAF